MREKEVSIIGAGLVGSLMSLFYSKRGFKVTIFEKREDPTINQNHSGRSINLVLTNRGINALKILGIDQEILEYAVPVYGRSIHDLDGNITYQPYGVNKECNYSISRNLLNIKLIEIAKREKVNFMFNQNIEKIDLDKKIIFSGEKFSFNKIIGADGINSAVRHEFVKKAICHSKIRDLGVSYKEFTMPALPTGVYALDKNSLHIWPHGEHFAMALPNLDGSFTMTLYLAKDSKISFQNLLTLEDYKSLLENFYPEIYQKSLNSVNELFENPEGSLGTLDCSLWNYKEVALIIGDAAHAITPFFGQGMNAGFEDCVILSDLIDQNISNTFEEFFLRQKKNGDAIGLMAEENYIEMSKKVKDEEFLKRKKIEQYLEKNFSDKFKGRYSRVMYSNEEFSSCYQQGLINKRIIDKILKEFPVSDVSDYNNNDIKKIMDGIL